MDLDMGVVYSEPTAGEPVSGVSTTDGAPVRETVRPRLPPREGAPIHYSDHRDLLPISSTASATSTDDSPDAIVVPSYRPAAALRAAAGVAKVADAMLVVLCSGAADPDEAVAVVSDTAPGLRAIVVDLRRRAWSFNDIGLSLGTCRHEQAQWKRTHDANLKRNAALLLGRMCGWDRILFLNDDVLGFDPGHLRRTLAHLDTPEAGYLAAGWAFTSYPDNSVVCHAHRLGGGTQSNFISDASLLVRVSAELPFFPSVYNEDWLFLYPMMERGRVVLVGEHRGQVPYRPFARPLQAAFQEFGDVLAEGLLRVFHENLPVQVAEREDFWTRAQSQRLGFIEDILHRLADRSTSTAGAAYQAESAAAQKSVVAARDRHTPSWPADLATFVKLWRQDLIEWQEKMTRLDGGRALDVALKELHLYDLTRFVSVE